MLLGACSKNTIYEETQGQRFAIQLNLDHVLPAWREHFTQAFPG